MSTQPFTPEPSTSPAADSSADRPSSLSLTSPATLEALLSLRPHAPNAASAAAADATVPSSLDNAQPPAGPALADSLDSQEVIANIHLLFVAAGTPDSAMAQAWLQRMQSGAQLHTTGFQNNVPEQALQLMPQAVLVEFDPGSSETAAQLVAQLRTASPHLPCLAVGRTRHPQSMLAALRAGVQDFLDVDGSLQAAQQTLRELIQRHPPISSQGPAAPLTAIIAARAGLGSSLLASHLAWYLQQQLCNATRGKPDSANSSDGLDNLLIDLGNPNGDCSLYLNTLGEFDFLEAVGNLRRFDRRLASSGLTRHESGLRLLPLPRQAALQRDVSYSDADALVQRLRQYFRHVVADLGAVSHTQLAMRVVRRASEVWVVCEQSVASVVSTTEMLKRLEEMQIERERMRLIVNRHDSQLELDARQIARQLQLPLLTVIPEHRRELAQAVNQGKLLGMQQRRDPYVQAVDRLVTGLLAQYHPGIAAGQRKTSGLAPLDSFAGKAPASALGRIIQRIRRS